MTADTKQLPIDRRQALRGAAMAGAGAMFVSPTMALSADSDMTAVRKAAEAGREASVIRIQDWIKLPSIAAENRNMTEGADYMAALAKDAGFQHVEIVPTDGHPGVFATLDAGAKRTLGIYFMYDVKQFDASEWSSPPLAAAIVDRPGFGKAIMGRGAVNQKGPEATFLAALHAIRAAGKKLPVNIVLIAEGEEEIGSPHFKQVATKPNVLAALKKCEGIFIPASWQDKSGNDRWTTEIVGNEMQMLDSKGGGSAQFEPRQQSQPSGGGQQNQPAPSSAAPASGNQGFDEDFDDDIPF